MPSELYYDIYWRVTYEDLKTKLKLFIADKQYSFAQDFQVISQVVAAAFGGGKKANENVVAPKTGAEAVSTFNKMFNKR